MKQPSAVDAAAAAVRALETAATVSTGALDDDEKRSKRTRKRRSKLQLQCADGRVFDVTHEEAMMSSTLWMLVQDVTESRSRPLIKQHLIPMFDVPSSSVDQALLYCRCLYKQQVEGENSALQEWEERFFELDSKTLCDLAKVASHLDIQPLVDITCRSIAQIMSATEAAQELRHKFGLEDPPPNIECTCEIRNGMNGFDFGVFNSLDHDLPTEEYELVEFDQPSVDELLNFINGSGNNPNPNAVAQQQQQLRQVAAVAGISIKQCRLHGQQQHQEYLQHAPVAGDTANTAEDPTSSSSKKKKKKKKKKTQSSTPSPDSKSSQSNDTAASASPSNSEANHTVERRSSSHRQEPASSIPDCRSIKNAQDLEEMLRLAAQNPSAVFQESQFEDEDDEEMDEQIESFRLALESAHLDSLAKRKRKPRVQFAPQDVFRTTLVASQRESVQRVIT